jgi:hypothetical protein
MNPEIYAFCCWVRLTYPCLSSGPSMQGAAMRIAWNEWRLLQERPIRASLLEDWA